MFFPPDKKLSQTCVFCLLFAMLAVFTLGACQKDEAKVKDPKATLDRIAETYWSKRFLERDYNATYAMEAAQGTMTLEEYKRHISNRGQIAYESVKATGVNIEGKNGKVDLIVACRLLKVPKPINLSISDRWVLEENEWKHVLSKKHFSPS